MDEKALVKMLCAEYCSFYKPGKDEELACQGYRVAERLINSGTQLSASPEKPLRRPRSENALFQAICSHCPFFEQDCDFAECKREKGLDSVCEAIYPCGGFLCLGNCIDQGIVDIQEIYTQ